MKKLKSVLVTLVCLATFTSIHAQNWPSFRGVRAAGISEGRAAPTAWDGIKSINLEWKTAIPGLAHSSPVVWNDRIFITTAVSIDKAAPFQTATESNGPVPENVRYSWRVYCIDKNSGRILWDRTAHEGVPRVKRHLKATQANATPVTDGQYVVALFGSEGLFCFDVNGRMLWKKDLGILDPGLHEDAAVQWGHSSSPVIYKNLVLVQADCHAQSFLAAFDLKDGKQMWRVERGERPSWSTPTIYDGGRRVEVITTAPHFIRAYDPMTGRELWRMSNSDLIVQVPTPFIAHEMFYTTGGWPGGRPVSAIRPGASGDISLKENQTSNAHIVWRAERAGPYVPTPIVYGDYLYSCNDKGVLACHNAKSGEQIYQRRISDQVAGFSASPVASDGKIYFPSEDGDVFVLRAGPKYELLSINPMGEPLMATPAISDGMIILRGQNHLFAVKEKKK